MADTGLNFIERLKELQKERQSLDYRKSIAERFLKTAQAKLNEIDEEMTLINEFIGEADINDPKAFREITAEDIALLEMHPTATDRVRRGAMTPKEKVQRAKELKEEAEEKAKQEAEEIRPNDKSRPQQPKRAGEKTEPEQPIKTPEERQASITEKLKQKDPRKQKEGLEELKKPENKDLGKDDPEFQKLVKESSKRVERFDKIRESLRKNLKELMQSDSEVVKKNMAELRAGRIGSGVAGFQEIARSTTDTRFNSVAQAAKGLCQNVAALYKEFDIKPEEALSREALNEARPTFTRQTGNKTNDDKAIDRNSRQNRYMGESNELSEEERLAYAKVKKLFGVDADKLPPVDAKTKEEMAIVRAIIHEDAQKPNGKLKPAMIIQSTNEGR